MSRIAVPKLDSKLLFRQLFTSTKEVADSNGVITSSPVIDHGASFDGTDDKITYPTVRGVKSAAFWIKLATTTEDIMELSSTQSIEAVAGTLTATGLSSPTFYVNGVASATIGTTRAHVVITTATAFNADSLDIGADDTYGEFTIEDVQFYSVSLTAEEVKDLYEHDTYAELNSPLIDLPLRSWYYKENGVQLLVNGDVGTGDTTGWTPESGAILSVPSAGILRVTGGGSGFCPASQTVLTSGKRYKITGDIRGDGDAAVPTIGVGSVTLVSGTFSNTWQPYSVEFVATATKISYYNATFNSTGYTEFRNTRVELMENLTENRGSLGGTAKMGDGSTTTTMPTILSPHGWKMDGTDYGNLNYIYTDRTQPFSFGGIFSLANLTGILDLVSNFNGTNGLSLTYNSGLGLYLYSEVTQSLSRSTLAGSFVAGKLQTVICTYDGSSSGNGLHIYIDGKNVDNTSGTGASFGDFVSTATLLVGKRQVAGALLPAGSTVRKPFAYLRELTPTQVRIEHNRLMKSINV